MQQESNNKHIFLDYIIPSILVGILSIVGIIILGKFYKANEHSVMINVLVWSAVILLCYLILLGMELLIYKCIFKRAILYLNVIPFAFGYIAIGLFSLFFVKDPNDSLFVIIMICIGGFLSIIQFVIWLSHYLEAKK